MRFFNFKVFRSLYREKGLETFTKIKKGKENFFTKKKEKYPK